MADNETKYFVFSDMEMKHRNKVLSKIGLKFYCGTIPVESKIERFTNIISKDKFGNMRQMFPDVKIVLEGIPSKLTYTDPEER